MITWTPFNNRAHSPDPPDAGRYLVWLEVRKGVAIEVGYDPDQGGWEVSKNIIEKYGEYYSIINPPKEKMQ